MRRLIPHSTDQPSGSPPARPPALAPGAVTRAELARGYLQIGLMGFGGVAPWARRVIVEERRWLDDEAYAAIVGMGQVLPGANTLNAAVIIGDRFQGPLGSLIAVVALMAAPLVVLVILASLYARFAGLRDVQSALGGVAAAAAGLVIGTGVKMAAGLRLEVRALLIGLSALLAVAVFKLSLVVAVLVLAPVGVLLDRGARRT